MYNSRIILLTLISPFKFDVKPEKFDCENTELSGVTDKCHKATRLAESEVIYPSPIPTFPKFPTPISRHRPFQNFRLRFPNPTPLT